MRLRVVGSAMLVASGACEAHGLVGSNVSADTGAAPSPDLGTSGGSSGEGHAPASGEPGAEPPGSTGGAADEELETTATVVFDVAPLDGVEVCRAPQIDSCDHTNDTLSGVLGPGCDDSRFFEVDFTGHPSALRVHKGVLGTSGEFSPREGERMLILSTGRASDVPLTHEQLGCDPLMCPSTALDTATVLEQLPPPLDVQRVSATKDCAESPALVGQGDCSNTLEDEWKAGGVAQDYAEIRLKATVPEGTDAFAYQFAFFSAEYPLWTDQQELPWNDMYVAWLESEAWTGNISFDEYGSPISIGSVFLDYLDGDSSRCPPGECVAPELDGFAMDGHAGTRWLETVAPVRAGEEIEVVFAVFDLADAVFDTVVVLDNVHWTCTDLPPITSRPEG